MRYADIEPILLSKIEYYDQGIITNIFNVTTALIMTLAVGYFVITTLS